MNNQGFFWPKEKEASECLHCKLDMGCKSPRMEPAGKFKLKLMAIAEAPGEYEDEQGEQLVGESGQCLREALEDLGGDLDKDFIKLNSINCRPPKNKVPTSKEIEYCRPRVWNAIEKYKPEKILLLGNYALESFLRNRWSGGLGGINKWRGHMIPDRKAQAWVMPTFHPSYVIRCRNNENLKAVETTWMNDLERFLDFKPASLEDLCGEENFVKMLDEDHSIKILKNCGEHPIAFDFETTGLKPHAEGHKIVVCSVCISNTCSFVFEITERNRPYLREVLTNKNIKKIAYNAPFENMWSNVILKAKIKNWWQDPAIAAHILDNRKGIGSLEVQAYLNYGLLDFKNSTGEFLKGKDKKNSNSFNRVKEAPRKELMIRCGIDSLITYQLAMDNKEIVSTPAYRLFHEGSQALMECEKNGIRVDIDYLHEMASSLENKIKKLEKRINKTKEGRKWREIYGIKTNYDSPEQIREILFTHLGYKFHETTKTGKAKADKDTLEKIRTPFIQDIILPLRKLKKAKGTYLESLIRESVSEGEFRILHSLFSLNTAVTYRSSSHSPNFQNIPIRDKEVSKLIRSAFIPRPGRQIMEIDFKGIEVGGATCYHKDPNMISYLKDPTKDMHRDMAMECFLLVKREVSKDTRYAAKNGFVFPQFYGDWYKSCAENLWEMISSLKLKTVSGIPLKQHLKKKKIRDFDAFVKHIKQVEDQFWNDRFPVYKKWKEKAIDSYDKTGSMESLIGFTYRGVLKPNEIVNYRIQGTAFHILLRTLTLLHRHMKKKKMKSKLIGQIHDSMVIDLIPEEKKAVLHYLDHILKKRLPKEWPWIIVPLEIEAELAPIDKSWYEKKEINIKEALK